MKVSTFQNAVRLQFDTLTKRVIDTTIKDYNREISRRSKNEVSFSDISDIEYGGIIDTHDCEFTCFNVLGNKIQISNDMLGTALKQLPERKLKIILMFYFLEMSDIEIAEFLDIDRTTSFRIRKRALEEIHQILLEVSK